MYNVQIRGSAKLRIKLPIKVNINLLQPRYFQPLIIALQLVKQFFPGRNASTKANNCTAYCYLVVTMYYGVTQLAAITKLSLNRR